MSCVDRSQYTSGKIAVTTSGTEITYAFDYWAAYPIDGDITVELFQKDQYSPLVYGFNGIGIGDEIRGRKIRIKAITGTVNVAYYLKNKNA